MRRRSHVIYAFARAIGISAPNSWLPNRFRSFIWIRFPIRLHTLPCVYIVHLHIWIVLTHSLSKSAITEFVFCLFVTVEATAKIPNRIPMFFCDLIAFYENFTFAQSRIDRWLPQLPESKKYFCGDAAVASTNQSAHSLRFMSVQSIRFQCCVNFVSFLNEKNLYNFEMETKCFDIFRVRLCGAEYYDSILLLLLLAVAVAVAQTVCPRETGYNLIRK